jgi:hypothetical protein
MGQWQLTNPAKGKFASKKMFKHVLGQFYVLWPISPRPSMACSFCAPQSRADGAMVAQKLDQL